MADSNGKTAAPIRKTAEPVKIPQPHGGALLSGGKPGNKGGGRTAEYVKQRAAEILEDPVVWDIQHAYAKAGKPDVLDRALKVFGLGQPTGSAAAELELPNGVKFRMMLGERDLSND